ncbi:hypothetical protein DPMN_063486 [Dreissena polymorpha]|uniref:Uncharacterized protein n=1 Tax=Dreissena polymorpha TaxID=45954 RepID=A0A9D4CBI9_DREPO|nr:hypothetical protein DPMN_063486 [Dreissena polymorpha]
MISSICETASGELLLTDWRNNKVKSSKKYNVKIKGDTNQCSLTGICETASGELLLTDWRNNKVKLLDQTYKVVAHCDLRNAPWSMCSIDSNLVAVTVTYKQVHFIRVTNGQLIKDRILKLKHDCFGIAHQHGNLYITDGNALYLYTVDGRLVREMYKDTSYQWADGNRIYVTNKDNKQLVTLSKDGKVKSTLNDSALDSPRLLAGRFRTSSAVDRDGRQRLAEVVTENNGVVGPTSVYYSKHTGSIIVGMDDNNDITDDVHALQAVQAVQNTSRYKCQLLAETNQPTNRPTNQQTNSQGKNNMSPTTILENGLTKFHEDWAKNVASRVSPIRVSPLSPIRVQGESCVEDEHLCLTLSEGCDPSMDDNEQNVLTKFQEDWTINVASRVLTRKNSPPHGDHVFNRPEPFSNSSKISLEHRARKTATTPGSHVFQPTATIFQLFQDIIGTHVLTHVLTQLHVHWTINVASRELTS